jgi:hypothetical protein
MDIIIKVSDINGAVISREFIAIARYHKGRYFADAKLLQVLRLDFDTVEEPFYGGNIYKDYDENNHLIAVKVGQGKLLLLRIFKAVI